MDASRFDALSRKLAAGVSRRAAFKGAAAGLLGALGLRTAATAQVSQAYCGNVTCITNPGKCKPGCVCCVWSNGNSRCMPPHKCGAGGVLTCPPERPFVDPVRGCVACLTPANCPAPGTPCQTATCTAGVCGVTGGCATGTCCVGGPRNGLCALADGSDCWTGGNDACCSGACADGVCVQPGGVDARCDDDDDCLSGLICCDNLGTTGPDFTCRDPNTDIPNCGACLNHCAPNEICESATCICPSGHEVVSGGCFQITDAAGTGCPDNCTTSGSIIGSGNFLCVGDAGFNCDENSFCGEPFACQGGGVDGSCVAPC